MPDAPPRVSHHFVHREAARNRCREPELAVHVGSLVISSPLKSSSSPPRRVPAVFAATPTPAYSFAEVCTYMYMSMYMYMYRTSLHVLPVVPPGGQRRPKSQPKSRECGLGPPWRAPSSLCRLRRRTDIDLRSVCAGGGVFTLT